MDDKDKKHLEEQFTNLGKELVDSINLETKKLYSSILNEFDNEFKRKEYEFYKSKHKGIGPIRKRYNYARPKLKAALKNLCDGELNEENKGKFGKELSKLSNFIYINKL